MDYQFPRQLYPSYYFSGPPDSLRQHCVGNWGSYDRVLAQGGSGPLSSWTYTSRHRVRATTWRHKEPVPVPLMSPKKSVLWPVEPPDPLDFREHMKNFFIDHRQDAFGCMGEILCENLCCKEGSEEKHHQSYVQALRMAEFEKVRINQKVNSNRTLDGYSSLLSDVVHSVCPELLGDLLYRELTEQRNRLLFPEEATGGALAFIPFSQSPECGCLIYPGNPGLDCLNFHQVEFEHQTEGSPCADTKGSSSLFRFQLKGPVRQISSASLLNQTCVAVRSDYLCGVWGFSETDEPRLYQVINSREVATCVSVSPHVLGEVLVATERGTANLWTVGRGTQKVREEDTNLYFNAKSSWRWCEFSAHPRVILYADRTGVELTDIRVSPAVCHTLFHISKTQECRNGERLILCKYLSEAHPFHHLVTTQFSAYIMDERFPGVPMLKMEHMTQSPPMFCHIIPGSSSEPSAGGTGAVKVLLGSPSSQEITLLQYSGGRTDACSSLGPPQALLRPRDSLRHLPVQVPHLTETTASRLSSPAAGLTCVQMKADVAAERLCVLQLTAAGDIFYQIIEAEQTDVSTRPGAESSQRSLTGAEESERPQTDPQLLVSETSSDEDMIAPTQAPTRKSFVPESPVRVQRGAGIYMDSSSEDSQPEQRKRRNLKRLNLEVLFNEDPELDAASGLDNTDNDDGKTTNEEPGAVEETGSPGQTEVQLSDSARRVWKVWLRKLSRSEKPRPHRCKVFEVHADNVLPLADHGVAERKQFQRLRRDLRACMSKRLLLVHAAVPDSIKAPDLKPLPHTVDTDAWTDQLSQRLTLSWRGEGAWRAWWENSLGLNREQRVDALRRKRRKEKEARRASGRRLELSGSFTSSISYQSELSDFSDHQGWSSATSQELGLDFESVRSQLEGFTESEALRAATPLSFQTDAPQTPQSTGSRPEEPQTPSSSHTPPHTPRPSSRSSLRISRRPAEDALGSVAEPSQPDSFPPEDPVRPVSPPVAAPSQLSTRSLSQRTLGMDLSQDSLVWSVSQSFSQSSQGRPGLSRSSQPKKKSRMGF